MTAALWGGKKRSQTRPQGKINRHRAGAGGKKGPEFLTTAAEGCRNVKINDNNVILMHVATWSLDAFSTDLAPGRQLQADCFFVDLFSNLDELSNYPLHARETLPKFGLNPASRQHVTFEFIKKSTQRLISIRLHVHCMHRAQLSKTVFGTVCQHPAAKPGIFPSRSKNIRNLLVDGSRLFWLLYWKVRPVETPDFRASILKHNLSPSKKKCRTSHHQSHRRTSWRDGTKKESVIFFVVRRSRARPTWTWRSSTTTTQSLTHCLCNLTKRWAVFCRTSTICFEKKCPDLVFAIIIDI